MCIARPESSGARSGRCTHLLWGIHAKRHPPCPAGSGRRRFCTVVARPQLATRGIRCPSRGGWEGRARDARPPSSGSRARSLRDRIGHGTRRGQGVRRRRLCLPAKAVRTRRTANAGGKATGDFQEVELHQRCTVDKEGTLERLAGSRKIRRVQAVLDGRAQVGGCERGRNQQGPTSASIRSRTPAQRSGGAGRHPHPPKYPMLVFYI